MTEGKDLRQFREEILEEMYRRDREGPINGLDGMFLDLACWYEIYPDDIMEKYEKIIQEKQKNKTNIF